MSNLPVMSDESVDVTLKLDMHINLSDEVNGSQATEMREVVEVAVYKWLEFRFCQQQYFRIQPKDVKVHEGGEVILQCEVAHLGGMVQWTKDGFALGRA
uniref:Ig-like domain-containing protein n=1 Tax=Rhodnius prolixus TaxID=13249 RepID=T1HY21_RHOPR